MPLIAGIVLAGCAAGSRADRSLSPEEIERAVVTNHRRVSSLFGTGTLSVETPEIAQTASFELSLRKPDSILVRIEGPFGIDLGIALLTRDEFFFYNSMQNRLVTGPSTPENFGRFLRVGIGFEDLLNMFSGGTFLGGDGERPDDFAIEDDLYVLTYRHSDGVRRYWVDPETFLIVRIQHMDTRGTVAVEQTFSRFEKHGDVTVPRLVRVVMRREHRRLSIAFSDVSLNPTSLTFRFDVPADAERARVP